MADPWQEVQDQDETKVLDIDDVLDDNELSQDDKKEVLQKLLFTACSNGDVDKVHKLLGGQVGRDYIDINAKDSSGSTALIYSSCFGNEPIVQELLRFGADPDIQDNHEWTALMWAINNHHAQIVRALLENGNASLDTQTSSGKSALAFVSPGSEISKYLENAGYIEPKEEADFYRAVQDPEDIEADLEMQMASAAAVTLDVSLSHLTLEDTFVKNEPVDEDTGDDYNFYDHEEFVWDKCLPQQMFAFRESEIPQILDVAISDMKPQRTKSQKPIPANMLFLAIRYAHYYATSETLENLLDPAIMRMGTVIRKHKNDISFLAFWMSNCLLLLYYIRKDNGVFGATAQFQEQLYEVLTDIYNYIILDAEDRMDKVLDASILDYETIPGLDSVVYQKEWNLFRSRGRELSKKEEVEQVIKPPSPHRKMLPSPRNVTGILSSVLFVLELYAVHPIVCQEVISQLLYWLGAVLFNRVISTRKYLSRTRAMQIRLNVSAIEDWARINNRRPEDADEFSDTRKYPSTVDQCRKYLSSIVQMLQWLQCFSGFGDDFTNVVATLQQLKSLNPNQLLHVAKKYRAEVGEKGLSKEYRQYLTQLAAHYEKQEKEKPQPSSPSTDVPADKQEEVISDSDSDDKSNDLYLDSSKLLPFKLPTLREMIVTWGAGLGGTHSKRARRFEPTLPAELIDKFESSAREHNDDDDDEYADTNTNHQHVEPTHEEQLFKDVAMPQPSVHRTWGDELDEVNPTW